MVVLMGGRNSQGYAMFQHLTVKAFLALRPYADQLIDTVRLMLDTGLPSFKGEGTIKRLRERFALGMNERNAAEWMVSQVKNAHENVRSTAYDEFQRVSRTRIELMPDWWLTVPSSFKMVHRALRYRFSLTYIYQCRYPIQVAISIVQQCPPSSGSLSVHDYDRCTVRILENTLRFVCPGLFLCFENVHQAISDLLPLVFGEDSDVTLAQCPSDHISGRCG